MAIEDFIKLPFSKNPFFDRFKDEDKKPAKEDEKIRVKIVLKPKPGILVKIGKHLPLKKRREAFAKKFGADKAHVMLIEKFASKHNLDVVKVNENAGIITLYGAITDMQKAFKVKLFMHRHKFRKKNEDYEMDVRGHSGEVSVPGPLGLIVQSVIGLDNVPMNNHSETLATLKGTKSIHAARGYSSGWFAQYYNFPRTYHGDNQRIAIISPSGGYNPEEFEKFFNYIGMEQRPTIDWESVNGAKNNPGQSWMSDYEVHTDVLVAACAAKNSRITVYFCNNDITGFADTVEQIADEGETGPSIISYSWGASESSYSADTIEAVERILQSATEVDQLTILCSSGDYGANNNYNMMRPKSVTEPVVEYPASSAWVTACGGTMLTRNENDEITNESVWNSVFLYGALVKNASGGGFSRFIERPDYQKKAISADYVPEHATQRGVPDVSAHADVSPDGIGFQIYMQGKHWVTGGTSSVPPFWAALVARLNQARGKRMGFLNPYLYQMAGTDALTEITEGTNTMYNDPSLYQAGPGWNACTGLGIPHGRKMLEWFKQYDVDNPEE